MGSKLREQLAQLTPSMVHGGVSQLACVGVWMAMDWHARVQCQPNRQSLPEGPGPSTSRLVPSGEAKRIGQAAAQNTTTPPTTNEQGQFTWEGGAAREACKGALILSEGTIAADDIP